jgi:hypothetical protein
MATAAAPATVTLDWQPLPDGQPVLAQPGYYYAVVAMVDVPQSKIESMAAGYGLTILASTYQDNADPNSATPPLPPAKSGYRYVAGQAVVTGAGGEIPWSVPAPFSLFDSSTLIHAWGAPPPSAPPGPLPTLTCPAPKSAWPEIVGGAVAGALAFEGVRELFAWLKRRRS